MGQISDNQFKCAECGGVFDKGWTDEEAAAEKTANGFDNMLCVVVCDDCYKEAMARNGHRPV